MRGREEKSERLLIHVLNSSPIEVHWVALAGHSFKVVALDGNPVLDEVRKHVQAAGMGIVVEYAGASTKPVWNQPDDLVWNYRQFAAPTSTAVRDKEVDRIELSFDSKFQGHGNEELWRINGKSYPNNDEPVLKTGQRYRLVMKNLSMDDHPMHLHRHLFEVRQVGGSSEMYGLKKDLVLVPAKSTAEVEFVANNPGLTLFHCHQQDHMDRGFMMVFRYA